MKKQLTAVAAAVAIVSLAGCGSDDAVRPIKASDVAATSADGPSSWPAFGRVGLTFFDECSTYSAPTKWRCIDDQMAELQDGAKSLPKDGIHSPVLAIISQYRDVYIDYAAASCVAESIGDCGVMQLSLSRLNDDVRASMRSISDGKTAAG